MCERRTWFWKMHEIFFEIFFRWYQNKIIIVFDTFRFSWLMFLWIWKKQNCYEQICDDDYRICCVFEKHVLLYVYTKTFFIALRSCFFIDAIMRVKKIDWWNEFSVTKRCMSSIKNFILESRQNKKSRKNVLASINKKEKDLRFETHINIHDN